MRRQWRSAGGTFIKVFLAAAVGQHVVWQIDTLKWQVLVGSAVAGVLVVVYNWADTGYTAYGLGAS